jgi:hypothetical protein
MERELKDATRVSPAGHILLALYRCNVLQATLFDCLTHSSEDYLEKLTSDLTSLGDLVAEVQTSVRQKREQDRTKLN